MNKKFMINKYCPISVMSSNDKKAVFEFIERINQIQHKCTRFIGNSFSTIIAQQNSYAPPMLFKLITTMINQLNIMYAREEGTNGTVAPMKINSYFDTISSGVMNETHDLENKTY